jgi:hypothetical protein
MRRKMMQRGRSMVGKVGSSIFIGENKKRKMGKINDFWRW